MMSDYYYYAGMSTWVIVVLVISVAVNIGLAFVVANIAKKKGYSYGAFWCLSFFASFIVGLIVAISMPDKYQPPYQQPYQPPYQQPYQPPAAPPYQAPNQQSSAMCPNCGRPVSAGDKFCQGCGTKIG